MKATLSCRELFFEWLRLGVLLALILGAMVGTVVGQDPPVEAKDFQRITPKQAVNYIYTVIGIAVGGFFLIFLGWWWYGTLEQGQTNFQKTETKRGENYKKYERPSSGKKTERYSLDDDDYDFPI